MTNPAEANDMTFQELLSHVTQLMFYPKGYEAVEDYNYRAFGVEVIRLSDGKYSVKHWPNLWNGKKWEDNNSPKNATKAFKARTRFELADAIREAKAVVEDVKVSGLTFQEYLIFRERVRVAEETRKVNGKDELSPLC